MTSPSPAIEAASVSLLTAREASAIAVQWDRLAENASEPNSFYERWFLEPSLRHLDPPESLRILTIWSRDGALIGLAPFRSGRSYGRTGLPAVENWLHYNQFVGVPLVAHGREAEFWQFALPFLDAAFADADVFYFSEMPADCAVTRALLDVCKANRRPSAVVHRSSRAILRAGQSSEAYWAETVRKKKRKEIARLENRLAETGDVLCETLRLPQDAESWIADFLTLEAAGWKGQDGAALARDSGHSAFFREAMMTALTAGKAEILRLSVGPDVIAMLVNLLAGEGSFSFKIAYDERYARFSPGILIEKANLARLDDPDFGWMDSCAVEDHPMINSLWRDRREMVRIALPRAGVKSTVLFHAARAAETGWSALKQLRARQFQTKRQADDPEL